MISVRYLIQEVIFNTIANLTYKGSQGCITVLPLKCLGAIPEYINVKSCIMIFIFYNHSAHSNSRKIPLQHYKMVHLNRVFCLIILTCSLFLATKQASLKQHTVKSIRRARSIDNDVNMLLCIERKVLESRNHEFEIPSQLNTNVSS